ncbi:MAG: alpha/beta hydrolase [Phycisphaeraceae bacterium]|nr:alpha/beta hydrolase [Phycisphaeraceae bacterium]
MSHRFSLRILWACLGLLLAIPTHTCHAQNTTTESAMPSNAADPLAPVYPPPERQVQPASVLPEEAQAPPLVPGIRRLPNLHYRTAPTTHGPVDLLMDVYLPEAPPPEGEQYPLILYMHGGGWKEGTRHQPGMIWLVRRGYAVATIDYRLSHEAVFPAQIQDVRAALRWIRAHADALGIDPDRIGAAGVSAGAHLAALLGLSAGVTELDDPADPNLQQSDHVAAVCDFFGPAIFQLFLQKGYPGPITRDAVERLLGGPIPEHLGTTIQAGPISYVTPDDPPFLIVHGDKDPVVPVEQSQRLYAALQEAGVPSTYVEIPGGGHGDPADAFIQSREARQRVVSFFDAYLKLHADTQPATTPTTQTEPYPYRHGRRQPLAVDQYDNAKPRVPDGVTVQRNLIYRTAETNHGPVDLLMDLYLPPESRTQPVPVILNIHGGGWAQGSKSYVMTPWITGEGYALASIEYRFGQESPYPAQLHDVKAAIRWLRTHAEEYHLDPNRVGVIGASSGGHLAAMLGVTIGMPDMEGQGDNLDQRSDVQAVADLFGPADLPLFDTLPAEKVPPMTRMFVGNLLGGPLERNLNLARIASPVTYATAKAAPFLIVHGVDDPQVAVEQSRSLYEKLTAAGATATLVELPGAGHGTPREAFASGPEARQRLLEFFDRYLKTSPQP